VSGEVQAAAVLGGLSESEQLEDRRGPLRPRRRRVGLGDWLLPVYVVLAFIFLLIPIAYTFVFSFNDSLKSNIAWRGFTFDKWLNVCNVEGGAVCEAFGNSIVIGLVSTVAATGSAPARRSACCCSCRWPPPRWSSVRASRRSSWPWASRRTC
jgi:spermidine/putrescine transport system permease protein